MTPSNIPIQTAQAVKSSLNAHSNKQKAKILQRFFKTGPGEYAEGDIFIGVSVPDIRKVSKKFYKLPIKEIKILLRSPIHEERLAALIIMIHRFRKGTEEQKENLYSFYLENTRYINNWDLVDLSAPHIVGAYLKDKDRKILCGLAFSEDLWERRIAILSTFHYIKAGDFKDALAIAEILLNDGHDLIHKAVGWMLREIGKRDTSCEETFLLKYYCRIPRTMLRYAIEKFPEKKRQAYLKGYV